MMLEINYKTSIHGPNPKKPGELKLLFRNKTKRAFIDTKDIKALVQYHGEDGKLDKERCEIVHLILGNIVINLPYETVSEAMLEKPFIVRGYKQYKQKKK